MRKNVETNVKFFTSIKNLKISPNDLIVVDKRLLKSKKIKSHLSGKAIYAVNSGEKLKKIENFPAHIKRILSLSQTMAPKSLRIIAIGGGSVGDFAGFTASILKRGVTLIHVPSTWLSAVDSSHGGKTALNVGNYKNQIGTFYPAFETWICKELLFMQPPHLALDGFGEMLKTAILDPRLSKTKILDEVPSATTLWKYLKAGISYKYKIVRQDPFEKMGTRSLLNFGHTMGHAFEMLMGWPHGKAVLYGLAFDIFWSEEKGFLSNKNAHRILGSKAWQSLFNLSEYEEALRFPKKEIENLILQDKKRTSTNSIRQVFIKNLGRPIISTVSFKDIVGEYERQKTYFY